jgi:RNA-directed DNA polymerase
MSRLLECPRQQGVPQGGIISPVLANIALDGLEELLAGYRKTKPYKSGTYKSQRYGYIRYADDFLITAETKEDIEAIVPKVVDFLHVRGLELNSDKTNIVPVDQGFNFLGFRVRKFHGSCYIMPQKEKIKDFLKGIRDWLKANKQATPEMVIYHLNPILRGWGNYYKHSVSKQVFSYVDHEIWKALWKWSLRRHPNKGKRWVANRYFKTINGRKWNFAATVKDRRGEWTTVSLVYLPGINIERHVKVKGAASPDDPELKHYWEQRQTRYGKTYWDKGSKLYKVAVNQNWRCSVCHEHLFNGESLNTHHLLSVAEGGTDTADNLVHLHTSCHRHLHHRKTL